uniref:Uncharacterized protein n=1 Tax=Oryza nivara TaxID=4536 RepID=A0A0E0HX21_ORYNI
MLTGERRCGGSRRTPGATSPRRMGIGASGGEETKHEAEVGWDGLGCSPVSECGGSRRTPAPPLLAGCQREARRRESRAAGEETGDGLGRRNGGRAALCCRILICTRLECFHLPKKPHKSTGNLLPPHSTLLSSQSKPSGHPPMIGEKGVGRLVGEKLDGRGHRLTWLPTVGSAHIIDLRARGVRCGSQLQLQCRLHLHARGLGLLPCHAD